MFIKLILQPKQSNKLHNFVAYEINHRTNNLKHVHVIAPNSMYYFVSFLIVYIVKEADIETAKKLNQYKMRYC